MELATSIASPSGTTSMLVPGFMPASDALRSSGSGAERRRLGSRSSVCSPELLFIFSVMGNEMSGERMRFDMSLRMNGGLLVSARANRVACAAVAECFEK